jgi:hypothetical protein
MLQNLGTIERRYDRFEKSLVHYDKAKDLWPGFCDVDAWRAKSLLQLNRYEARSLACNLSLSSHYYSGSPHYL